ncbi:MAG: NAD(P)H-dependent oxidoreductase [Marinibacterium sp.]|nr:NAD(P)H-dependent oxidoreductase [Marinibacterium sp.]
MTNTVLHIDASARADGSVSRQLSAAVVDRLGAGRVIRRDLANAIPQITETWVGANFTPADARDALQRDTLALSDALVDELQQADTVVIGAPMYNFGIPASLKAWIDQIARAGLTFKYTDTGPVGLLDGKRAIVVIATGGVPVGAPVDFVSPYLRHVLGFVGITDVQIISADQLNADADSALSAAQDSIAAL